MNLSEFTILCNSLFELNNVEKPDDVITEKLYMLTEIMLESNKLMNLTAIIDEKAIIVRHYIDSLSISAFIPYGSRVADVGCGAGFPSLPLAIFRPDISITGIDSTAKRINYVNNAASRLDLNNFVAIAIRAEEASRKAEYRDYFDIVTARAVASLPVLCELCLPLVKCDGMFIAMKSQQASHEAEAATNSIKLCAGRLSNIIENSITLNGNEFENRSIILIDKIRNTPQIYPRLFSQITKKPL